MKSMSPIEELADIIRHHRTLRRWSQEELARRSGVPKGTIGSIEAGNVKGTPTFATLLKLEKALHLADGYLVAVAHRALVDYGPAPRDEETSVEELKMDLPGGPFETPRRVKPQVRLKPIDGGLSVPEDAPDQPDSWELEVLEKTGALGSHDYSKESDFWYLPREDRRALLRHLEDIWFEDQRLRKRMAERRE